MVRTKKCMFFSGAQNVGFWPKKSDFRHKTPNFVNGPGPTNFCVRRKPDKFYHPTNSAKRVNSVQAVYSAVLPPSLVVFLFLKTTNVFWCFGAGRCEDQLGISVNLLYRGRYFWFSCFFCWRFSFGRTWSRLRCTLSLHGFGDGVDNPRGEGGKIGEDSCNNLLIAHQLLAIFRLKIWNIPFSFYWKSV